MPPYPSRSAASSRSRLDDRKLAGAILRRFAGDYPTDQPALIVDPIDGLDLFPNHATVSRRPGDQPDLLVAERVGELDRWPLENRNLIARMGMLEHLREPVENPEVPSAPPRNP